MMLNQRSPGLPGLVVLHLNLKAKQGTGRALAQDTSFNSAFTPAAFGLISMSFRFRCQFSSRRPVALFPVISVCSCDHTGLSRVRWFVPLQLSLCSSTSAPAGKYAARRKLRVGERGGVVGAVKTQPGSAACIFLREAATSAPLRST